MTDTANARLDQIIADCQNNAREATARLLKVFSFVPDGKLAWSPAPTARTSLALMAHCAMGNKAFASIIRGETMSPMPTAEQMHASMKQFEVTVRDRATAARLLQASCDEVVAALASLTPQRYATTPSSPFGPMPMSFWAALPAMHMNGHATQMDYLQTIWGDMVDHM